MLFWILVVLALAIAVAITVRWALDDGGIFSTIGVFFGMCFLTACGGGLVLLIFGGIFMHDAKVASDTHAKRDLVSLQTAQQGRISGSHYYLGSGIINGESGTGYTYMYQAKDDNGSTYFQLDNALASDSKVYTLDEGSDQRPSVDIETARWEYSNGWIMPWALDGGSGHAYTFYVPKDSIVSNYQAN
jgi:uncharacterized membrane protein